MGEPIVIVNREPVEYKDVENSWTYERILELFPDGNTDLVNPLVRRCQAHEAEIDRLHETLRMTVGMLSVCEPYANRHPAELYDEIIAGIENQAVITEGGTVCPTS